MSECTDNCVNTALAATTAAYAAYNDPNSAHYKDYTWLSEKLTQINDELKACMEACDP